MHAFAAAALAAFLAAAPDLQAERAAIRRADEGMSRATGARDADGFLSFVGADAIFGGAAGLAEGRGAVAERWKGFFAPGGPTLTWTPETAEVSASADLGYTTGRFRFEGKDAAGKPSVDEGGYVTVWRKDPDGAWRVLFDMGNRPASGQGKLLRKPSRSHSSRAGDLEATVGTWSLSGDAGGRAGAYLTIRRRAKGRWRVVLDSALPYRPPS
jgi:ketosteroid isomerase-like protein